MGKFATNKNGNIDSGTEVLANNITFLQQTKSQTISNLFGDLFDEGILSGFELSANADGTFNVGVGIGYKKDVNSGLYNRIAILEETNYHNELFGDSTYPDGRGIHQKTNTGILGEYVDTPKSTGCLNIPISANETTYYIDLRFLNVCDNGNNGDGLGLINYSIAKNIVPSTDKRKRFYKWIDGYDIELVQNISEIQGICLGTVQKDTNNIITFTNDNKTKELLIKSKIIMDYFIDGSGITIIEEDDKKKLSINVDNITTEIENNKVRITKDALYSYNKFVVNSGNVDINNVANVISIESTGTVAINFGVGSQIPLVVSPAYNDRYTIYPNDTVEIINNAMIEIQNYYSETAQGKYIICVNNTDKDNNNAKLSNPKLEIMKDYYITIVQPNMQKGRIWLDMSKEPFKAKWCNGANWIEYHGVPLGTIDIDSNVIINTQSYPFGAYKSKLIEVNRLVLYNNVSSAQKAVEFEHDSNNYLHLIGSDGIAFNEYGYIDILPNKLNINFGDVTIQNNPIPRLPDYSAYTQLYGSDASRTITIQNDGWLFMRCSTTSAYCSINNAAIIDDNWNTNEQKVVVVPVKAGDSVSFRYTVLSFCPYR